MENDPPYSWLRYPCYGLFHLPSLAESERGGYLYDIVPAFCPTQERENILSALDWAEASGAIDWEAILPGLPHSDEFKRGHLRITRWRLTEALYRLVLHEGRCPDCGAPVRQTDMSTFSGREMRDFACTRCGWSMVFDCGPALWKLLSDAKEKPRPPPG